MLQAFVFAVLGLLTIVLAPTASAATRTVTNTLDSGPGSLRQTVISAASGDKVTFSSSVFSVPLTITLYGQIEVNKALVIDGSSPDVIMPTISGDHITRTFQIKPGAKVTLNQLRIVNGTCIDFGCNGGGIFNNGTLTVSNVVFISNTSLYIEAYGGAIFTYISSTLFVTGSTFMSNTTSVSGGAIAIGCGQVTCYPGGSVSVVNSQFIANSAGGGGALSNNAIIITITNSSFTGNSASYYGGAIHSSGRATIVNSTFWGNSASNGGAIHNAGFLYLINSTVAGNSATYGGGIDPANMTDVTTWLTNTIVASNTPGDNCDIYVPTISDGGHNIDSGTSCGFAAAGSLNNTDPYLGSLGNYGGATWVLPLILGSPAIGTANPAVCPATDERGMRRGIPVSCDIGAFEYWYPVCIPLVTR
ncbi:MAG: hypothetical protein M1434_06615 [Chloroflexi bacterium]|nr:hypothetical protein [Chloroflexota bacterium]MCL5274404.1 hypothetical protein [Chloroflexota bacterium]